HGQKTANGEVFNQNKLTAAHRTLPLGTTVEVTNVTNGKSVEVKINDRGPFVNGRVIDVSGAAAVRLGMKETGLARVQIEVQSVL
ncbi:MAG: septal ring lytic transglycosylase RlpA family protein, partial [bacterium]